MQNKTQCFLACFGQLAELVEKSSVNTDPLRLTHFGGKSVLIRFWYFNELALDAIKSLCLCPVYIREMFQHCSSKRTVSKLVYLVLPKMFYLGEVEEIGSGCAHPVVMVCC